MSHASSTPLVSVVIPSCQGADRIGETLRSLADQTLAADSYEIVVVLNGPLDATPATLEQVRREHPRLRLRSVHIADQGAGPARNAGVAAAAGAHLTFVDDDDSVSPTFLEALVDAAGDGVVSLAMVADVVADGGGVFAEFDNYLNRRIAVHAGADVPGEALSTALGFVAAKLVPTALARAARFDTTLRSGEDVVYWFDLFNRAPFLFRVVESSSGAAYHRSVRVGSISRQAASYDFSISQRLDVIERLAGRTVTHPAAERVRGAMMAGQTMLMNGYLREADEGEHRRAVEEVRERGLEQVVRYDLLNAGLGRDLAVCYAFMPYVDTSAMVAARRVRARGVVVDVVSQSLKARCERDQTARLIAQEFVGEHRELPGKPGAFNWRLIERFATRGLEQVATWEAAKGPYRSVYSRVMWPASHVLAAAYKVRHPQTRWIAEFSDPQQWDSAGQRRTPRVRQGPIGEELLAALAAAGVTPGTEGRTTIAELVEHLAYCFADEIVFTNENQREVMLGYLGNEALAERARSVSTISEHPTLEPSFYQLEPVDYDLDPSVVNLAYFGVFYRTRALSEVIEALATLPAERRDRVRLHVFTSKPAELAEVAENSGLRGVIIANPFVSFLAALNLATRMDVLLINDARTVDLYPRNPYLPSKWSDYAGSGSEVWAVVEPGSVLSGKKSRYQSQIGDVDGARAQLDAIIEDHL